MAALATQKVAFPGITPTYAAASAGGDTAVAGDQTYLIVKNGGGASINVTLLTFPDTSDWGSAIPDLIVAVPAAGERWIGPLRGSIFTNGPAGSTPAPSIAYSAVTSVTVGVFTT